MLFVTEASEIEVKQVVKSHAGKSIVQTKLNDFICLKEQQYYEAILFFHLYGCIQMPKGFMSHCTTGLALPRT